MISQLKNYFVHFPPCSSHFLLDGTKAPLVILSNSVCQRARSFPSALVGCVFSENGTIVVTSCNSVCLFPLPILHLKRIATIPISYFIH